MTKPENSSRAQQDLPRILVVCAAYERALINLGLNPKQIADEALKKSGHD